jgi:prepilin-type N-terminal cleavage/methylation domain-containing protein
MYLNKLIMKLYALEKDWTGFSIAEVLICVALIGILAAFTVPPILKGTNTDQTSKYNAMVKGVAVMISTAYERYKAANGGAVPTTMTADNLMPYMSYSSNMASTQQLDTHAGDGGIASNCTPSNGNQPGNCYGLHNGGALWSDTNSNFGGSTTLNVIYFRFDPNAKYDGVVNDAPGMAIQLALYYDGYVKTRGTLRTNSTYYSFSSGTQVENSVGNEDPGWFTGF